MIPPYVKDMEKAVTTKSLSLLDSETHEWNPISCNNFKNKKTQI